MTQSLGGAVRATDELADVHRNHGGVIPVEARLGEAQLAESRGAAVAAHPAVSFASEPVTVPDYLRDVYHWAYLSPVGRAVFDHPLVVHSILWGNMHRLTQAVVEEITPGQTVLQPACVYGNFSSYLAQAVGPQGRLFVTDVAPIQVSGCQRKLDGVPQATVSLGDAARPTGGPYDVVACFFLLHEVPEPYKKAIVNALLGVVAPGGKAVFVDYHRPGIFHPLKGLMSLVFDTLEPFAKGLWAREIDSYALSSEPFEWSKQTYFGGMYQKVVARRR
ncbi:MAG: rhodoquinone biosynthesis methyltransferase RquA [Alphaproteobacteria bacterium]